MGLFSEALQNEWKYTIASLQIHSVFTLNSLFSQIPSFKSEHFLSKACLWFKTTAYRFTAQLAAHFRIVVVIVRLLHIATIIVLGNQMKFYWHLSMVINYHFAWIPQSNADNFNKCSKWMTDQGDITRYMHMSIRCLIESSQSGVY